MLAACDEFDGVKNGILNDPRQCHFDPAVLKCHSGDGPDWETWTHGYAFEDWRKLSGETIDPLQYPKRDAGASLKSVTNGEAMAGQARVDSPESTVGAR